MPFACALFNLSKLAVWWLRLGIHIERIKPGHPQQNGRHERMHLPLKKELTSPSGKLPATARTIRLQAGVQLRAMKSPAECYTPSKSPYRGLPGLEYPFHDRECLVTACGRLCLQINISTVLAGQKLGIKEVGDGIWLVNFMTYDLGYFDLEQNLAAPRQPFGPRLSPMS